MSYTFGEVSASLSAPGSVVRLVDECFEGCVARASSRAAEPSFRLLVGDDPDLRAQLAALGSRTPSDEGFDLAPCEQGLSGERYLVDVQAREALLSTNFPNKYGLLAMRWLRLMLHIQLVERGFTPVHGGAFSRGESAVVVVGDKHAGKTTAVLLAVLRGGLSFVANDTVYLRAGERGVEVVALPMAIGVRPGCLALFPQVAEAARREALGADGRLYLRPAELAALGGGAPRTKARLTAVIEPHMSPHLRTLSCTRQGPERGYATLLRHRLTSQPFQFMPYWERLWRSSPEARARAEARSLERIARERPVIALRNSPHTNRELIDWFHELTS